MQYQRVESPLKLDGPEAAQTFFAGCFAEQDPEQENLWVAHLDEEARCLHLSKHAGDSAGVDFPLRKIIVDAARHNSASILLAHNHPSGDARPSQNDMRATRNLVTAARALGVDVADHLVFGGGDCTSLRSLGYL